MADRTFPLVPVRNAMAFSKCFERRLYRVEYVFIDYFRQARKIYRSAVFRVNYRCNRHCRLCEHFVNVDDFHSLDLRVRSPIFANLDLSSYAFVSNAILTFEKMRNSDHSHVDSCQINHPDRCVIRNTLQFQAHTNCTNHWKIPHLKKNQHWQKMVESMSRWEFSECTGVRNAAPRNVTVRSPGARPLRRERPGTVGPHWQRHFCLDKRNCGHWGSRGFHRPSETSVWPEKGNGTTGRTNII